MKRVILAVVCTVVVAAAVVLRAQDAAKVDPAPYKVLIDNPSVRVLWINYARGPQSVMHQHPDSIVIPMSPSKVEFTRPDGTNRPNTWRATRPSIRLPARTIRRTSARLR